MRFFYLKGFAILSIYFKKLFKPLKCTNNQDE